MAETENMERAETHAVFATHLRTKVEYDDLREMARAVEELEAHPGWQVLDELVTPIEKGLMATFMGWRIPDHVEYAKASGELRGLRVFRDAAQTVRVIYAEREEEERQNAEDNYAEGSDGNR